jgi:6-phosphogluconolactonase
MNLSKISRTALASIVSLAMALGLSSCSLDYVVGYVYITTAKSSPGVIDQYAIDFQSGALSSIGTPIAAGNNPVRLVAAPNGRFIYVINQGDSTVQEFAVQGDGTLASKNTYNTGSTPTAIAIDPQGAFLYVAFRYQAGYSATTPGPGGVSIFPVNADNSLGASTTQNVGNNPVGISVSYFNHFVYVLDQETSINPQILGFSQNTANGALTPVPGTTIATVAGKTVATGYAAGVVPSAIAEEPTSRFLYVTDQAANQLIGYTVAPNGALTAMVNGPFADRLVPRQPHHRPHRHADLRHQLQLEFGAGLHDQPEHRRSIGRGWRVCHRNRRGADLRVHRSRAGHQSVHLQQPGQHDLGDRLNPNTGGLQTVQNSPFNGSPQPLPDRCAEWVTRQSGSYSVEVISDGSRQPRKPP